MIFLAHSNANAIGQFNLVPCVLDERIRHNLANATMPCLNLNVSRYSIQLSIQFWVSQKVKIYILNKIDFYS